ncbi:MAG TPA: TadE/TadG family type IV pilus assembly protein [Gemmatimonadaceae bacterium]|nr:TadE/TadG family type IV pilus assembly protein [Gemmatimonadaceae bacterium]
MLKRLRNQRGAALIETAITIPLVLLVSVSIFEFGRAYQTWQVLTNAAREGARIAVLPDYTDAQVTSTVRTYLTSGRLSNPNAASIIVVRNVPFGTTTASRITVNYPFNFIVLNPVARLVRSGSTVGTPLTMQSSALMRNE